VVTHPERKTRAAFSEQQLKSEIQGRKAGHFSFLIIVK
jgi:hypothetical protein